MKHLIRFLFIWLVTKQLLMAQVPGDFGFETFQTGQAFTSITVDKNHGVWAGTNKAGLFYKDSSGLEFSTLSIGTPELSTVTIESMAADQFGNVWVGQSGTNSSNGQGGLERIDISNQSVQHYSPNRDAKGFQFFERDGIATLNVKGVTVSPNGAVWLAQWRHQLVSGSTYILTPGSISYKTPTEEKFNSMSTWEDQINNTLTEQFPYPDYTYNPPFDKTPQSRNVNAIASNNQEVWASVFPYIPLDEVNLLPTRILVFDSETAQYQKQYNLEDCKFPTGGVFNGLYVNNNSEAWATVSMQGRGFSVYQDDKWFRMNPEIDSIQRIIPPDTRFNDRAIWGNDRGNVFLGTNNGILVYDGKGPLNHVSSYTLYSKTYTIAAALNPYLIVDESMSSNNILGGASEKNNGEWIVTDNGIMHGVFVGERNIQTGIWMVPTPSGDGFAVQYQNEWFYMTPENSEAKKFIPEGTKFNSNAIWRNKYGNFFIGTDKGLLVYDGRGPVDSAFAYTFYTNTPSQNHNSYTIVDPTLLSNNVIGGETIGDTIQKVYTLDQSFNFKVGFIKVNFDVDICPTHWRKNTHYCRDNPPSQCLNSVSKSNNEYVIGVESAIADRSPEDHTYHCYQIDTKIGNPKDENGEIFTVERIFELMKNNAEFQAITPFDMPREVLGDNFLKEITDEHVDRFVDLVNTKTEQITTVQSIMNQDPDLIAYEILDNTFLTSAGLAATYPHPVVTGISNIFNPSTIEEYQAKQIEINPKEAIHESQIYKLYNTPDAARTRATFIKTFYLVISVTESCGFKNLEDKRYDEVVMHIDETNYTITNYTVPGHYFHPGKITRTVYRDDQTGDIYVRTVGEGLHFCKGNPNGSNPRNDVGSFSGRLNTIMGMILFKNVDLRLRDYTRDSDNWKN